MGIFRSLFNWLFGSKKGHSGRSSNGESRPENPWEDPARMPSKVPELWPIEQYLHHDFKPHGYYDAVITLDVQGMHKGIEYIKRTVLLLINRALGRYEREMRQIDFLISLARSQALHETEQAHKTEREVMEKKIQKLRELLDNINAKEVPPFPAFVSYEIGYMQGVKAVLRAHRSDLHPLKSDDSEENGQYPNKKKGDEKGKNGKGMNENGALDEDERDE